MDMSFVNNIIQSAMGNIQGNIQMNFMGNTFMNGAQNQGPVHAQNFEGQQQQEDEDYGEEEEEEQKLSEEEIKNIINSYNAFKYNTEEKDQNCAICLDKLKEGQMVKKMPCKHTFHSPCINNWLKHKLQCPLCKV